VESIVQRILGGTAIAMITDAGTPGISDPGFLLVRACVEQGIEVESLPGPTAFVPALVNSGLPCERFVFEGFLPQKKGRQKRLKELSSETRTMVLYESPYRLVKTLIQLAEYFGQDRKGSVSRELTKVHEETVRGTLPELAEYYSKGTVKGEIVIVIEGAAG
jgi:16S rRNA (cytidine1402-2'-O)-methyltransferase